MQYSLSSSCGLFKETSQRRSASVSCPICSIRITRLKPTYRVRFCSSTSTGYGPCSICASYIPAGA